MKRNEAREYFQNLGLDYSKIDRDKIEILSDMVGQELEDYFNNGGLHAQQMGMVVKKLKIKDVKVNKNGLESARIRIRGSYFDDREGITFSCTGFIGFGGELDDENVQPMLKAFCNWCNLLVS